LPALLSELEPACPAGRLRPAKKLRRMHSLGHIGKLLIEYAG